MHRPNAVFPAQSEAPAAIESRALGTLAYIRASIESSSSMDVPGMAGIVMGIIGVLAAVVVSLPRWRGSLAGDLAGRRSRSLSLLGGALVARQTARRGQSRYLGPVRKFLLCLCPALLAGAVLTLVLATAGMDERHSGHVAAALWLRGALGEHGDHRRDRAAHLLHGCLVRRSRIDDVRAARPWPTR